MLASALVVAAFLAIANAKGVFYALSANGIDIINPVDLTIEKRLPYNTPIPGTSQVLCTYCPRHRSQCSWGGAATVKGKYVFAADANGNRVIVIDITTQQPIKSIPTDGFPYQVTYIAALDEVWVFCWKDSKLNVVGSSTMETKIHRISQASNLMIVKSIKAQIADSYEHIMHGYLQAENCQNVKLNLQYGVVSHFNEPGIHKIDLKNKLYETFINTTLYGCRSTFGLAYSSVTKYAFVQCLGRLKGHTTSKILIIDVKREKVAKTDAALTFGVTGTPYASPDGKYVLIINQDKIITYYMKDKKTAIKRLKDVPATFPSRVAFVEVDDGFVAYVTLKNTTKMLTITYRKTDEPKLGYISGVGKTTDLSKSAIGSRKMRYLPYYNMLLAKKGEPFSGAKFDKYVMQMIMTHVTRPIATGCGGVGGFVASPAAYENKVAILNGKTKKLVGLVDNVQKAKNVIWVKST